MLPERPQFGSVPCPACGRDVDAIRAARVLWMHDGPRFLCGERCQERFVLGERQFDIQASTPTPVPSAPPRSATDRVRDATQARELPPPRSRPRMGGNRIDSLAAFGFATLAFALVGFSESRELGWIAASFLILSAAASARAPLSVIRASPPLRWVAPAGLAMSTVGVLLEVAPLDERLALLACAGAAIPLSLRNPIHTWAHGPVRTAGRELEAMVPMRARIPGDDASSYEEVPAHALRPGDLTVVLEGEKLPADGVVEEGMGIALLYPRASRSTTVAPGDFLLAGTQVVEGALTVRARRTHRDRAIVRALNLHVEAMPSSSRLGRFRRLLETWAWAPIGLLAVGFAATAGISGTGALLLGLPVLACVAAIDAPLDAATRSAARRGMLFGGVAALVDASQVRTTAILLRGALTAGEPFVRRVKSLGTKNLEDVVGLAAAAERIVPEHPVARAIIRHSEEREAPASTVRKPRVHPGLGVTAVSTGGSSVVVGRRQLLLDEGISVATADEDAARIESEGLTPILVAVGGSLEALFAVLDPIHVGAQDAVRRLAELPSEVVIMSGDERRTVERIAEQLWTSRVKAPLLPKERALEVRALRETGGTTAAVGRGDEDDAVLAAADVPVSLRLAGTATEQRGIVAAGRDVRDAAGVLWIARAARRAVAQALATAIAMGIVVVAGAWLGWLTPPLAVGLSLGTEVWALRAGSRLIRRVDLRVPMRQ